MGLFLVLFWCTSIACAVLPQNSRFGALNSRLGANKFPFNGRRELTGKRLIHLILFGAETVLFSQDRENSRFHGNNRECPPAANWALAQPAVSPIWRSR